MWVLSKVQSACILRSSVTCRAKILPPCIWSAGLVCCATILPPCQPLTITISMWRQSTMSSYYAIVLRWCQAIGRYDRPLIHVNPTTTMGRSGGGEITPVHPFNLPSLLISSPSNPDLSALKLTWKLWNPHHQLPSIRICVLCIFCSLICASFVPRFVFIPSCIRNKLYVSFVAPCSTSAHFIQLSGHIQYAC